MNFKFKIQAYQENNLIKVRVDMLADENYARTVAWSIRKRPFHDERFGITYQEFNFKKLNYKKLKPILLEDGEKIFACSTFIYQMPTNAVAAHGLILYLTRHLAKMAVDCVNEYTEFSISTDREIEKNSDPELLGRKLCESIAGSICAIDDIAEEYLPVVNRMKRVYGDIILADKMAQELTNPQVEVSVKVKLLCDLVQSQVHRKEELTAILSHISSTAKKDLIKPCIGKMSHYGIAHPDAVYDENYTELQLLKDAQFVMRHDGRMSINIKNNSFYLKYYAKGRRHHDILQAEMLYLGKVIGFEYAPDNNFHEEIIFTEACTNVLKSKGLHFNENYLKKLMTAKHHGSLFSQAYQHEENNDQHCYFHRLPPELMEIISNMVMPELDKSEAREAQQKGWGLK